MLGLPINNGLVERLVRRLDTSLAHNREEKTEVDESIEQLDERVLALQKDVTELQLEILRLKRLRMGKSGYAQYLNNVERAILAEQNALRDIVIANRQAEPGVHVAEVQAAEAYEIDHDAEMHNDAEPEIGS